jgi:hypothetical protein
VHLEGLLAGPGRWRIAGRAKVHTPWPLPDFSLNIDESWGSDRETPQVTVDVAQLLAKEIANTGNWSAQLPQGNESFLSLAQVKADDDVLAHPLGSLVFQQKLVPFELRLAKASGSKVDGANEFFGPGLGLSQGGNAPDVKPVSTRSDFFAAAQFLEMSQDDRMAKPSFELFTAGYELNDDTYDLGDIVEQTLNYEEADLGAPRTSRRLRRLGLVTFDAAKNGALMRFGAAGLSKLRDRALAQPPQPSRINVGPAPVVVADRNQLQVVMGGTVHTSFWRADQARAFDLSLDATVSQVAELAEVA